MYVLLGLGFGVGVLFGWQRSQRERYMLPASFVVTCITGRTEGVSRERAAAEGHDVDARHLVLQPLGVAHEGGHVG